MQERKDASDELVGPSGAGLLFTPPLSASRVRQLAAAYPDKLPMTVTPLGRLFRRDVVLKFATGRVARPGRPRRETVADA